MYGVMTWDMVGFLSLLVRLSRRWRGVRHRSVRLRHPGTRADRHVCDGSRLGQSQQNCNANRGGDGGSDTGLDRAFPPKFRQRGGVNSERVDIAVIGAGPAGAAAAIRAARSGATVVVFEKGAHGRDKVCGDGLTPRAVGALNELKIPLDDAHHIRGLRMIAGKQVRELDWPTTDRFPNHGAVWPRRRLDAALMDAAAEAGAEVVCETEATPILDNGRVTGVDAGGRTDRGRPDRRRRRRAGCGGADARRRAGARRAVRPGDPHLRRDTSPRRRPPRGVPVAAGRERHGDPGLRLDVPRRRRHGQHRRRRAVDDEGVQEAQPEHAARVVPPCRPATTGISAPTSNGRGRGVCRCRRNAATDRDGWRSATPPGSSIR